MRALTLVVLLLVASLAPSSALATHWTIHDSAVDEYAARTFEDDAEVIHASGNPLDGVANHVTHAGTPGDGGLFLDALTGNRASFGILEAGVDIYPGAFASDITGRDHLLLPSTIDAWHQTVAWYGEWLDVDRDGAIDDVHDNTCGGGYCAEDEFHWKGLATGESIPMTVIALPSTFLTTSALGNESSVTNARDLLDRTERTRAEQIWSGGFTQNGADGSLLYTVQVFVLANARPAIGTELGYDLADPKALWDVDTYESLNGDLEALWTSSARETYQAVTDADSEAFGVYERDVRPTVSDTLNESSFALVLAFQAVGIAVNVTLAVVESLDAPSTDYWIPKEPNTIEDDFEGRALFGGIGDRYGSRNAYDGYSSGHHFYFNAEHGSYICSGVYVRTVSPAPPAEASSFLTCGNLGSTAPLEGALGHNERSGTYWLTAAGRALLWNDLNGDNEIGNQCDADSVEFDADLNRCADAYQGFRFDRPPGADESIGVCASANLIGGTFTVTPMSGEWDGAILVRDQEETTRYAFDRHWQVLEGAEPAVLRWKSECDEDFSSAPSTTIASRDAIVFPQGSNPVPLRLVAQANIAGFLDVERGIEILAEAVYDVDYIPANL